MCRARPRHADAAQSLLSTRDGRSFSPLSGDGLTTLEYCERETYLLVKLDECSGMVGRNFHKTPQPPSPPDVPPEPDPPG